MFKNWLNKRSIDEFLDRENEDIKEIINFIEKADEDCSVVIRGNLLALLDVENKYDTDRLVDYDSSLSLMRVKGNSSKLNIHLFKQEWTKDELMISDDLDVPWVNRSILFDRDDDYYFYYEDEYYLDSDDLSNLSQGRVDIVNQFTESVLKIFRSEFKDSVLNSIRELEAMDINIQHKHKMKKPLVKKIKKIFKTISRDIYLLMKAEAEAKYNDNSALAKGLSNPLTEALESYNNSEFKANLNKLK